MKVLMLSHVFAVCSLALGLMTATVAQAQDDDVAAALAGMRSDAPKAKAPEDSSVFGGLFGRKVERQKERVEQRTDSEADQAADRAVDKTMDKVFNKIFGN